MMANVAAKPIRRSRRRHLPIVRILFLALCVIFVVVPLYWVFVTSIKPSDDYLAIPPVWWPSQPTMVHYTAALFAYRGLNGLINRLSVALAAGGLASPLPDAAQAADDIGTALQTLTPAEVASVDQLRHGLLQKVKAWLRGEA